MLIGRAVRAGKIYRSAAIRPPLAQAIRRSGKQGRNRLRAQGAIGQHGTGTLDYTPFLEDEEPRRPRSVWGRKAASRRLVYRRMGVLAAAIAVPAMAAPQIDRAPEPQVIRFVIPETIPYIPPLETQAGQVSEGSEAGSALSLADAPRRGYRPGPAAAAFSMSGTFTSRRRAEHCLTMAIYYEAASESTSGQRAVAQVVLNRVQHPTYPNSVCGVVFQGSERTTGCQFTFTCDGSLARRPQASEWARAGRVASAALGGYVYEPVGLATHYHTLAVNPYWASSLDPVGIVGAHRFYRWKGSAGQRAAFSAVHAGYEQSAAQFLAAVRSVPVVTAPLVDTLPVPAPALPAAPRAVPAATTAPANPSPPQLQLPGSVLEQHAASGQWLRDP